MKLIEITSQHRRDFHGIYECEGCGNKEEHSGYFDFYKGFFAIFNLIVFYGGGK